MSSFLGNKRTSGILAHITSLPSPYGIGDLGTGSRLFISFMAKCGQKYWQILPTGPTKPIFYNSPYMTVSAFAGSSLLISPELLVEQGLINQVDINQALSDQTSTEFSEYSVNFQAVMSFKEQILRKAFSSFEKKPDPLFANFCTETSWLDDYALFMVLKNLHKQQAWYDWPDDIARRNPRILEKLKARHSKEIAFYQFEQFEFHRQWHLMSDLAHKNNIQLIGDIPIYVGLDSVDVWANRGMFTIDSKTLRPTQVAGVPPDYFSKTGQRWGNPLYKWSAKSKTIKDNLNTWWADRFRAILKLVDVARIDHFRGFESYWAIPAKNKTAIKGKWLKGPGKSFFAKIEKNLGALPIIAEDLGIITPAVTKLREDLNFPGMKVLQFAFDQNPANDFLPYNYTSPDCVVYTGTHDNDTTLGWFLSDQLTDSSRKMIRRFVNKTGNGHSEIHKDFIYLAQSSTAGLSIIPLQDVLGFGNDCKMNSPGSKKGNWTWRCAARFLNDETASWLYDSTRLFGRLPASIPVKPVVKTL